MSTQTAISLIFLLMVGLLLYVKPWTEVREVEKPVIVRVPEIQKVPVPILVPEKKSEMKKAKPHRSCGATAVKEKMRHFNPPVITGNEPLRRYYPPLVRNP